MPRSACSLPLENTFLEQPFTDRGTGVSTQRFPLVFLLLNVSARNPDTTFNWAEVEPISGSLAFEHTNVTPYAEHYEFSLQRQFGSNTVLSVSYVGTQAHHLLTSVEANPASAALCEQLIADGASPQCGPFGEASVYTLPPGAPFPAAAQANPAVELTGQPCQPFSGGGNCNAVNGTYTVLPPQNGNQVFNNNPFEATIAQSSFNSLQATVRHTGNYSTFLFGYTYSQCRDDASELIEGINPFSPKSSMSLCAFDVTHNFVVSYETKLPFDRAFHAPSGWLQIACERVGHIRHHHARHRPSSQPLGIRRQLFDRNGQHLGADRLARFYSRQNSANDESEAGRHVFQHRTIHGGNARNDWKRTAPVFSRSRAEQLGHGAIEGHQDNGVEKPGVSLRGV